MSPVIRAVALCAALFVGFIVLFLVLNLVGATSDEDFNETLVRAAGSATGTTLVWVAVGLPRWRRGA